MKESVLALLLAGCVETELHRTSGPPAGGDADPGDPIPFPDDGVDRPETSSAPYGEGWGDPALEEPGAAEFLFEEGTIHRFDIELDGSARSKLNSDPKTDVEATFRYGDQSWVVGVHLKGSFSYRPLSGKSSFKIDFGEFVPEQRFHGIRRLTLNSMVQDRSMIREHVAYQAYAQMGVPAPRHGYAEVYVNDELYGLYGVLETLDGTWAERVFPHDSEGSLYEGGYGVDLEDGDAYDFQLQRQGDLLEPWTDVEALIEELDATPPEEFMALLEKRFDTKALFRMWAMDLVSGHRDGYTRRKNNFLVYHGLRTDTWWMVPWGQDQTMRDGGDVHGNYAGRLAKDCAEVPECQERLDQAILYVADVWEAWDLYGYAEAAGASIQEACERDPRRENNCGYESVLEMIANRPDEVRGMLDMSD
ncbi:MAG: CotH kinase family protein [Myxococcota bacterium]